MNVSLYQAAAALEGSLQRQDVIAENLAAAGIPGFKRSQVGFHSVNAEMFSNALGSVNKTELQYMLPRVTGYINFDQGSLMPSGDNNSLSIDGPGFFSVNSPEGTVYTRNGSFLVNSEGLIQKQAQVWSISAAEALAETFLLPFPRSEPPTRTGGGSAV